MMSITREFVRDIEDGLDSRVDSQNARPLVEVWPEEDEFGRWVAAHNDPVRTLICNTPEHEDSPYCGRGLH